MPNVRKLKTAARAPAPLDTPTDLSPEGVEAVSAALNGLLADAFALYLKTKNFHWHVSGPNFRDYHRMFEEHATQIFATTDPLAERVRKIGGSTLRSIGHVSRLQSIADNDAEMVPPGAMLRELLADNQAMVAAMRQAHDVCDEHEDVASASLLEEYIDQTEERVWFLYETSRGTDESGH
ncbi:MAG TPA: DNA starvation/stationary phase protection protein [Beijerinckiaceae bacterium]|jgi:starvation-inducible DNA-binding protein